MPRTIRLVLVGAAVAASIIPAASPAIAETGATAHEDAKGWLHVQTGPIARLGTLAEQLWPLGSQMTVYYNPSNPDKSYVERPIVGNFATLMFNIAGFLLIAMSILLYVLIQR